LAWAAGDYRQPRSFLKEAGHRLLRDRVWGDLRFVFQADHRHCRASGSYDFPHCQIGVRRLNLIATVLPLPFIRKGFAPPLQGELGCSVPAAVDAA